MHRSRFSKNFEWNYRHITFTTNIYIYVSNAERKLNDVKHIYWVWRVHIAVCGKRKILNDENF